MALNPLPMPLDTPLVNEDRTVDFNVWVPYFVQHDTQLANSAQRVVDVSLAAQSAAIAATPLDVGASAAAYRVSVMARITVVASVSSSLGVTVRWTNGGVALAKTWTALTGNTTSTHLDESFPIRVDAATSVTYETAYASVGTAMQYSVEVIAERLA